MVSISSPRVLQLLFILPYVSIVSTGLALIVANTLLAAKLLGCILLILSLGYVMGIVSNQNLKASVTVLCTSFLIWSTVIGVPLLDVSFTDLGVRFIVHLFLLPRFVHLVMVLAIPSISVIAPGRLMLGNGMAALSGKILTENAVTHVVGLNDVGWKNGNTIIPSDKVLQLKMNDHCRSDASVSSNKIFEQAVEFINQALDDSDAIVLVYCPAGISLSPLLVIHWLVSAGHVQTVQTGCTFVRKARPVVDISEHNVRILERNHISKND